MDNRTFWLGVLGGIVGGSILIGMGYLALRAYLPEREDPLAKMKSSFLETGTMMSRASIWDEMQFLKDHYDRGLLSAPLADGVIS